MKKQLIIEIICVLFIMLFVYAALTKLLDYDKFRVQIGQSPLLTPFAAWVAIFIPAFEILIAIMLAIPRFRLTALFCAFSLMIMFTAYIIAILGFSDYIPCSCGGVLQKMNWTQHLIFNIIFILLALTAIMMSLKKDAKNAMLA